MSKPTAQDIAEALTEVLGLQLTRYTELVARLNGLTLNGVLRSELVVLDESGLAHLEVRNPFASVGCWSYSSDVTLTSQPEQDTRPESGIGVVDVPSNKAIVWPLVGSSLTIYGEVGAKVLITLWSTPQVPSVGGTGSSVNGGGA